MNIGYLFVEGHEDGKMYSIGEYLEDNYFYLSCLSTKWYWNIGITNVYYHYSF